MSRSKYIATVLSAVFLVMNGPGAMAQKPPKYEKSLKGDFYSAVREPAVESYIGVTDGWSADALRALSMNWHPRSFDGDLLVLVTMGRDGAVSSVELVQSSGSTSQDKEAIRAIKKTIFRLPETYNRFLERANKEAEIKIVAPMALDKRSAEYSLALSEFKKK